MRCIIFFVLAAVALARPDNFVTTQDRVDHRVKMDMLRFGGYWQREEDGITSGYQRFTYYWISDRALDEFEQVYRRFIASGYRARFDAGVNMVARCNVQNTRLRSCREQYEGEQQVNCIGRPLLNPSTVCAHPEHYVFLQIFDDYMWD